MSMCRLLFLYSFEYGDWASRIVYIISGDGKKMPTKKSVHVLVVLSKHLIACDFLICNFNTNNS